MDVKLCKIVLKYTRATVTVHIYTITIALPYIILIISNFAPFFSLSSPSTKPTPSLSASSSDTHTPTDKIKNKPQKSKINHKINNKINHRHHKTKHTHTRTHQRRQREWIGVLGSVCLDQRAWISVFGSAFFSPCLDRSFRSALCLDRSVAV